ncbi:hypothetical protein ACPPVU_04660 [Mucilaginibacter sp. McL0603]|uniref:hypothetical protein n=1 Tax=Mucilaginibacter sp. McL0603 TaxID=3415670 RepID=UPI003CEF4D28
MKAVGLFILWLVCMVLVSCQNNHSGGITSKCGPCPMYLEILPTIGVKIVDKTTGADLFLSPTSPYKLSDLKVTSSVNDSVRFVVDSLGTGNRFVRVPSPETQTFTIKLAALSADSIRVVLARDSPVCCPRTRIKSITLNNVQQCSPCSLAQLVTIKK